MEKKVLFLDIDNTLYCSAINDVPQSAQKAIRVARKNGSKVFLCTGRSLAEANRYLNYEVDGFVFASGALVYAEGKKIYNHPIPEEDMPSIVKVIEECGMGCMYGGSAGAYLDERSFNGLAMYFTGKDASNPESAREMERNGMYHAKDRDPGDPIYKMGACTLHGNSFDLLNKKLPYPYKAVCTITHPSADFAEITNGLILKSTGVKKVMDYYSLDMKDSVGIGDSGNDVDMLKACGLGIAMGNAFEEAKEVADWITTDILEDGIWNAFVKAGVIEDE